MDDCIFCKIAAGQIPCEKIYEDQHVLAFLDINPGTHGHALVIPKAHYENIYDIEQAAAAAVMQAAQKVARALKNTLEPLGINLHQSNGAHAGQVVMHFHLHILPRYADDTVGHLWTPGDGGKDFAHIGQQLRTALAS